MTNRGNRATMTRRNQAKNARELRLITQAFRAGFDRGYKHGIERGAEISAFFLKNRLAQEAGL